MATEYVQFVGALILFAGILIGSYWFVYVPRGRSENAGSSAGGSEGGPGNTSAPRVRRDDER